MKVNISNLTKAAMSLRQNDHHLWEQFLLALNEYSLQVTSAMLQASPADLQKAQGMAVQAVTLLQILRDAPQNYEKVRNG